MGKLLLSADERRFRQGQSRRQSCRSGLRGGGGWTAAQDFEVEVAGFGGGLYAQFAPQRGHAELVLTDRCRALALGGVEPHQRAVAGLARRIEREQPMGKIGRLPRIERQRARDRLVEGQQRCFGQTVALHLQPALEDGGVDGETAEQRSAKEGHRRRQRLGRGVRQKTFERMHVDLQMDVVDADAVGLDDE